MRRRSSGAASDDGDGGDSVTLPALAAAGSGRAAAGSIESRRSRPNAGPPLYTPQPPQTQRRGTAPRKPSKAASELTQSPAAVKTSSLLRDKLRRLEQEVSIDASVAALERKEMVQRGELEEGEAWVWGRLSRHTLYHFEEEIIAPRLRAIQGIEQGERLLAADDEDLRRTALKRRERRVAEVLRIVVADTRRLVAVDEPGGRTAIAISYYDEASAAAADSSAAARELAAEDRRRRDEEERVSAAAYAAERAAAAERAREEVRELDRRASRAAASRTEADRRAALLSEEEDGRVGITALKRARAASLTDHLHRISALLQREAEARAEVLPDYTGLVVECEGSARCVLFTDESGRRAGVRRAREAEQRRIWLYATDRVHVSNRKLQRWVRRVLDGQVGRSASLRWVGQRVRTMRRQKEAAAAREQRHRERARRDMQLAEEEKQIMRFSLSSRISNLCYAETTARSDAAKEEEWQRKSVRTELLFQLVNEVHVPRRADLSEQKEPLGRRVVLADEAGDRSTIESKASSGRARLSVREDLVAAETRRRSGVLSSEASERVVMGSQRETGVLQIRSLFERRKAEASTAAAASAQRNTAAVRSLRDAQTSKRVQIDTLEAVHRFCIVEMIYRGVLCTAEHISARSVVSGWEEPSWRWVFERAEQLSRRARLLSLEMSIRDCIVDQCGDERADEVQRRRRERALLADRDRVRSAEAAVIQRWVRRIASGSDGWSASLRWVADALRREWVSREAAVTGTGERDASSVLRAMRWERRRRRLLEESERVSRATEAVQFGMDTETLSVVEVRSCRFSEDYWRLRTSEDEAAARRALRGAGWQSYLGARIQPAQRAWRCHVARRLFREQILRVLRDVSDTHEPWGRSVIACAEAVETVFISERTERRRLRQKQRAKARMYVKVFEASGRGAVGMEAWRVNAAVCEAAAVSMMGADGVVAKQERTDFHAHLLLSVHAQALLRFQKKEQDARLTWLLSWHDLYQVKLAQQEEEQRTAGLWEAVFTLRRIWEVERLFFECRVKLVAERQQLVDGHVELVESLWRAVLSSGRDRHLELCSLQHDEGRVRPGAVRSEPIQRRMVFDRQEEHVREMVAAGRLRSLKRVYRQKLEDAERTRLARAEAACFADIVVLRQASARELLEHAEDRSRSVFVVLSDERERRIRIAATVQFPYEEAVEVFENAGREYIQHQHASSSAHWAGDFEVGKLHSAAALELRERPKIRQQERAERRVLAASEQATRLHCTVLPIQRQWRVKERWLAFRRCSRGLESGFRTAAASVLGAELLARVELWEVFWRSALEAGRARDVREVAAGEAVSRKRAAASLSHRYTRAEMRSAEEAGRAAITAAEAVRIPAFVAAQEADQRVRVAEETPFRVWMLVALCGVEKECVRSSEERSRWRVQVDMRASAAAIAVAAAEPGPRDAVAARQWEEWCTIRDMEEWLRCASTDEERAEVERRISIESEERRDRSAMVYAERDSKDMVHRRAAAAGTLQRTWRRWMSVTLVAELCRMRLDQLIVEEARAREEAATVVQARWRGKWVRASGLLDLLRMEWDMSRSEVERCEFLDGKARTIQFALMRHAGHRKVREAIREANDRREQREQLLDMRDFVEELNEHARRIQSAFRMHRVRQRLVEEAFGGAWA